MGDVNKFRHTRGTWEVRKHNPISVVDEKGFCIATTGFGTRTRPYFEVRANAFVISKIPEMLEAIRDLVGDDPEMSGALERALALIAEIEGYDK